jgi:nucleoside-diphosphate-sugar epimerase
MGSFKKFSMTEKVLVIGGSGFFGRYLLKIVAENPLPHFSFYQGFFSNKATSPNSVCVNILDPQSVKSVAEKFNIIINCSGQITNPIELCYQQNTTGIHLLSRAIKEYNRYLIHLSSAVVYGSADYPDESAALNFQTPYAACKAFAEYVIRNEVSDDKYLILRIPNLYGGNQEKGLFAYLKRSFSSDKVLKFNNDGQQKKSFIHLEDSIFSLLELLKAHSSGVYNLPASDVYTIEEVIEKVEMITNCRFQSSFEESGRLEILNGLNASKFSLQTGYTLKHTIDSYIKSSFLQ